MARCRSIAVLGLLALWVAIPALACLPNPRMTAAEMACCKRMAGDCHMGTTQHSCCKTAANAPQAASIQSSLRIQPSVSVVAAIEIVPVLPVPEADSVHVRLGLPPPALPGLNSILRI